MFSNMFAPINLTASEMGLNTFGLWSEVEAKNKAGLVTTPPSLYMPSIIATEEINVEAFFGEVFEVSSSQDFLDAITQINNVYFQGEILIMGSFVLFGVATILDNRSVRIANTGMHTISAWNPSAPLIHVDSGGSLILEGIILQVVGTSSASSAISSNGNLEIIGSTIPNFHGAVSINDGTLLLQNSTLRDNNFGIEVGNNASITIDNSTITGNDYGIRLTNGAELTVANSTISSNSIGIHVQGNVSLLLEDATISEGTPIMLVDSSPTNLTLHLAGVNTLTGSDFSAGIHVPTGTSLLVTSFNNGELTATGGVGGAGIGGSQGYSGGTITIINSAVVTAYGGDFAAGIGGGIATTGVEWLSGGNITIEYPAIVNASRGIGNAMSIGHGDNINSSATTTGDAGILTLGNFPNRTVTVNAPGILSFLDIIEHPDDITVYQFSTIDALTVIAERHEAISNAITYQWFINTTNSNIGGTLIAEATSYTFTIPTNNIGTFYVYVMVNLANAEGFNITSNVSRVTVIPVSLEIQTTSPLSNGLFNQPYSQTILATGTVPIVWSIEKGILPPGLHLESTTGEIWGIPTNANYELPWYFTIRATDQHGYIEEEFSLTIERTEQSAPTINSESTISTTTDNLPFSLSIYFAQGTLLWEWVSTNPTVATVDATSGQVTIVGTGTTNIMLRMLGDENFNNSPFSPPILLTVESPVLTGTAEIIGANRIGQQLTVNTDNIMGGSGTLYFQWLADGIEIPGANNSVFTLTGTQAGRTITNRITRNDTTGNIITTFDNGQTVPFDIVLTMSDNIGNDNVTISQAYGRVGNDITINYTLSDGHGHLNSLLYFTGATGIQSVHERGTGSLTYTLNESDAVDGIIRINAIFTHTNLRLRILEFANSNVVRTIGDVPFANAITLSSGGGIITYSSSNQNVATVDNSGIVTIHNAGQTTITAEIDSDGIYIGITASYILIVNHAFQTAPDENKPDNNTPGGNEPDNNMPGGNEPDNNAPGGNEPDNNTPGGNEPDNNTPGGNESDNNAPGGNEPDNNAPGGNEPDNNAPGGNEPDNNAPGGNEPDNNIPDNNEPTRIPSPPSSSWTSDNNDGARTPPLPRPTVSRQPRNVEESSIEEIDPYANEPENDIAIVPPSNIPLVDPPLKGYALVSQEAINRITNSDSAIRAVEQAFYQLIGDRNTIAFASNSALALFAEQAIAQAASRYFDTNYIIVNQPNVEYLQNIAHYTHMAIIEMLGAKGHELNRELNIGVTFITTVYDQINILVEPSTIFTDIDRVWIRTPHYDLSFTHAFIRDNAHTTLYIYVSSFENNTDSRSYTITFSRPVTESVRLSVPPLPGEPAYQALISSLGQNAGGNHNTLTGLLDARINEGGTYSVVENGRDFADIQNRSPEMQRAIRTLAAKGIIDGMTPTEFRPDDPLTRAQVAALITRVLGLNNPNSDGRFADVNYNDWFFGAVGMANRHNIMNGTGEDMFSPHMNTTRDQLVALTARVLRTEMRYRNPASPIYYLQEIFTDVDLLADWSLVDLSLATREYLVVRHADGQFRPSETITRGEAAIIIYRLYRRLL